MSDKIIKLRNVRLAFPDLFVARASQDKEGAKPKYGANFLIKNRAQASLIAEIKKATAELIAEKGWTPAIVKGVAHAAGESKVSKVGEPYEGFDDTVTFVSARNHRRPNVFNKDGSPLTEEDDVIYPGCFVHANIVLYAYDKVAAHGRRICAQVQSVMFAGDGDPFSGAAGPKSAENEFGDVMESEAGDLL
jgi:hypothetical protein